MKKWMKTGLLIFAAAMAVSGCNGKEAAEGESSAAETVSEAELSDEASITLGNYKGLTLTAVREVGDGCGYRR